MKRCTSDIYYHGPVVVFDLDDTLYSEREYAIGAYRRVAVMPDLATPMLAHDVVAVMTDALDHRRNPFDALENMLKERSIGVLYDIPERVEVYRAYRPRRLSLYDDAAAVLDNLRQRGIRCAIITDGRSATQRAKLRALGIENYFHPDDILISEETGVDKSRPDNFAAIVHHYPEASQFIYVGDNTAKDFAMPEILGWKCYCLRDRGHNIHPQEEDTEAIMIDSLEALSTTI